MVQSLKENKTLKNALDAMKNTPIPVAVRMVDTGIGVRLPYIESSTVGEVAGKFSKASTAAKDDAYQLAKGTGNSKIQLGKEDLDALRKKWNVPETNTIAVGKTDVKGLRDLAFEGGSPEVRKEAGLPSLDTILPNREIRAPYDHLKNPKLAQFTRHAEEGVLNEFDYAIKKAGIEPTEVTGTLRIHQSNPRGVCNKCSKGLLKPHPIEKSGIFYQASKKYPNLTIEVTSEIDGSVKTNGLLSFVLKDGKIIE
ncbi:Uncharacterised protein [Streptococcus pneumoniae]|nr:Uncharacterised protein [Streptococcus pneumoniae]CJA15708.1 Uncharacterised protein [Streptococcus pneumoniae]CJA27496.1 Uncharacterised protein [Streptococcus pneumoniae]CJB64033.1 Uncharacterised protein [Streptococcus pneumoniae]CJG44574.1 Uncharacterised protein [Streptococcus pneumoniae]